MPDHATSTDPHVQAQLDRLWALSPGADILGLERITELLRRLGDPQRALPPVLHVAGTNGKGSTCAFLRTAIEAAGLRCHVYTSPHLVRFNERIRLSGELIHDAILAPLLAEVLDEADGIGASFFEVTTAAAFLAFARVPADACVIEVGLGGRLDATNVIAHPIVTGIAQLGIDHQAFLGDSAEDIAGEKAGIAKAGVPLVTMRYPDSVARRIAAVARAAGARWSPAGGSWLYAVDRNHLTYKDAAGRIDTPMPAMAGPHQPENLALAIAMLRHQTNLAIPPEAFTVAAETTRWPARMQRLSEGPLTEMLPPGSQLWLDGGHNAAAGQAIAETLRQALLSFPGESRGPVAGQPDTVSAPSPQSGISEGSGHKKAQLILGMLANKDPAGLLEPIAPLVDRVIAIPVPDHEHHAPDELAEIASSYGLAADTAPNVQVALDKLAAGSTTPSIILILGSLYLAGAVLAANGEPPE